MAAFFKTRLGVYGIVTVVIVLLTLLTVVGYRFYQSFVANTPQKAALSYIDTLSKGDMMKLYDMTRDASGQTQAEFASMMSSLVKDNRLIADGAVFEQIGHQGNVYYYRITTRLRASDGSYRLLPLLLEVAQDGNAWRMSPYLPPVAIPTGQ